MIFSIALRNIIAGRIRSILNIFVISLTLFTTICLQGIYEGMLEQMTKVRIEQELAGGHYWAQGFDPYDPLSLEEGHRAFPPALGQGMAEGRVTPILIRIASIYSHGRMKSVQVKGIPPAQTTLTLDFSPLANSPPQAGTIPAMLGKRMAKQLKLNVGDNLVLRLRTQAGAFNAVDLTLVGIFDSDVPNQDFNQVWLDLHDLHRISDLGGEATLIIIKQGEESVQIDGDWNWKSQYQLLEETRQLYQAKMSGSVMLYFILFFLALLAIFDTQALAIFRRKKEIGTLMALGMTPRQVSYLMTLEGCLYGVISMLVTSILGIPFLQNLEKEGINFGVSGESYGMALSDTLYPIYDAYLILGIYGIAFVLILGVSYWPARSIVHMKPYEALRGGKR